MTNLSSGHDQFGRHFSLPFFDVTNPRQRNCYPTALHKDMVYSMTWVVDFSGMISAGIDFTCLVLLDIGAHETWDLVDLMLDGRLIITSLGCGEQASCGVDVDFNAPFTWRAVTECRSAQHC
jgi:hypothetical protein